MLPVANIALTSRNAFSQFSIAPPKLLGGVKGFPGIITKSNPMGPVGEIRKNPQRTDVRFGIRRGDFKNFAGGFEVFYLRVVAIEKEVFEAHI